MRFRKMGFPFFQTRISHFQKTDMRFTDYVFLLLLSKAYNSPPRLGDRRGMKASVALTEPKSLAVRGKQTLISQRSVDETEWVTNRTTDTPPAPGVGR